MTPEKLEELAIQAGRTLQWQPLDELGALVVDGIRRGRYVIMKGAGDAAGTLHERAEALARGEVPAPMAHRRDHPGEREAKPKPEGYGPLEPDPVIL